MEYGLIMIRGKIFRVTNELNRNLNPF